jgi:hypothetical protein
MKILKKGNYFKVYNDNKEVEATISLKGKFWGATKHWDALRKHLNDYNTKLTLKEKDKDIKSGRYW